jgi:hypothetical protein
MAISREIAMALSCGAAVAGISYCIGIQVIPGAIMAPLFYLWLRST